MSKRKRLISLFLCVFVLFFLLTCQLTTSTTPTPIPDTSTPGIQLPTDTIQALFTSTEVPTNTPIPTDTPRPTNTPIPTDTPEPTMTATQVEATRTPTQESISQFADEHLVIVLDKTRRMQELPDDFDLPSADEDLEYFVVYLTVTEIKDTHITNMLGSRENMPTLWVESGEKYQATVQRIEGIKFNDPTDMTSSMELKEGSVCISVFEVPIGSQPVRIALSYDYKQDMEQAKAQSVDFEIDLTGSSETAIRCQVDNGQNEYIEVTSPYTSQTVILDGQRDADEWADAFCIDLQHFLWGDSENGEMLTARWWVQNDDQYLYFLVRVSKEIPLKGVAGSYFWPEYTGTWAHSDGFFVDTTGYYQDHSNWDESKWYLDNELSPPGSMDVEAAVSEDSDFYWFEIKKALDSGDGYDWSLEPGQIIGSNPHDNLLFVIVTQDSQYWRNMQMELGKP